MACPVVGRENRSAGEARLRTRARKSEGAAALALARMHRRGYLSPMADVVIYHNPGCSKSRGALEILTNREIPCEVVEYMRTPPDEATLGSFLDLLPDPPSELVRKDKHFEELGLSEADCQTRDQVVKLLLEHPRLLQRPVVVRGDRAVIARPSEKVLEILD